MHEKYQLYKTNERIVLPKEILTKFWFSTLCHLVELISAAIEKSTFWRALVLDKK